MTPHFPHARTAVVASYIGVAGDPPMRQVCESLRENGWRVVVVTVEDRHSSRHTPLPGVDYHAVHAPVLSALLRRLTGPILYWRFARTLRRLVRSADTRLVITHGFHSIKMIRQYLPNRWFVLAAAVLDVPVIEDSGWFDRRVIARSWSCFRYADAVWSSDRYKASLVQQFGQLTKKPLVCHNVPKTDYLPEPTWPRDGWLRAELRKQGATIGETGGCIVLRAGAIGEYGGLDETLDALRDLPENVVFLMMGRPYPSYRQYIERRIVACGLPRRAFLWDRPSDEEWKKTLAGADIGHLIHGPFPAGRWQRLYEGNSSLSNNRLFQYMAAGLPMLGYDDPRMADLYAEVPAFRVCRHSHLTEDLRANIGEMAANPALRERLGRIGRTAHCSTYNWAVQFSALLGTIMTVGTPVP